MKFNREKRDDSDEDEQLNRRYRNEPQLLPDAPESSDEDDEENGNYL